MAGGLSSYAVTDVANAPYPARGFKEPYEGPYLNRVAFPKGGIGAGMVVCLEGTGALSHVPVRNEMKVYNEPCMFTALCVKGEKNVARVLEGPAPHWKISGSPGTGNGAADYHPEYQDGFVVFTGSSDTVVDHCWVKGGWWDSLNLAWQAIEQGKLRANPPQEGSCPRASLFVSFSVPLKNIDGGSVVPSLLSQPQPELEEHPVAELAEPSGSVSNRTGGRVVVNEFDVRRGRRVVPDHGRIIVWDD